MTSPLDLNNLWAVDKNYLMKGYNCNNDVKLFSSTNGRRRLLSGNIRPPSEAHLAKNTELRFVKMPSSEKHLPIETYFFQIVASLKNMMKNLETAASYHKNLQNDRSGTDNETLLQINMPQRKGPSIYTRGKKYSRQNSLSEESDVDLNFEVAEGCKYKVLGIFVTDALKLATLSLHLVNESYKKWRNRDNIEHCEVVQASDYVREVLDQLRYEIMEKTVLYDRVIAEWHSEALKESWKTISSECFVTNNLAKAISNVMRQNLSLSITECCF